MVGSKGAAGYRKYHSPNQPLLGTEITMVANSYQDFLFEYAGSAHFSTISYKQVQK